MNSDLQCVPFLKLSILTTRTSWGWSPCSGLPVIGYSWACAGQILHNSMTAANVKLCEFRTSTHRPKSMTVISKMLKGGLVTQDISWGTWYSISFDSRLMHNDNPKNNHKWMQNSNLRMALVWKSKVEILRTFQPACRTHQQYRGFFLMGWWLQHTDSLNHERKHLIAFKPTKSCTFHQHFSIKWLHQFEIHVIWSYTYL